nr:uncharacterized protein LOC112728362 isoform X2 [Arachis hypogaea]XP_025634240.1 uncharacterized protein LOC112728362 isoform X2 [Arachis hypogaea]XP_029146693.1 uncharacterized protein LOC112728362 isoform X2 [Arachis hypogaea]
MVPSLLCVTVQGRGRRRATERCTEEEKRRRLPLPLLEAAPPRLWLPGNGVVAVGDCSQSCCSTSIILPFTVNFMGCMSKLRLLLNHQSFQPVSKLLSGQFGSCYCVVLFCLPRYVVVAVIPTVA